MCIFEGKKGILHKPGLGLCIFEGKKGILHKPGSGLCIFGGKAGNMQNVRPGLCIFEGKRDFCTNRGRDCAFSKEKGIFCKIDINKKDALEWEIGIEMEQISCFVKFYLTETL